MGLNPALGTGGWTEKWICSNKESALAVGNKSPRSVVTVPTDFLLAFRPRRDHL